ncbi:50S ribosomal protein L13 [Candidatus Woesearchaeota archaeon]|nr:50S ribosomal protein L13 [Candidatus Woesearchaeota archaeon]
MIINAENLILGRLASFAAKESLIGNEIKIINCNNAVIIGSRKNILSEYKKDSERKTPRKGPFIPRTTERFVKRVIRGMLPRDRNKGREALKRIRCYKLIPESLKNKETISLDKINVHKTDNINFIRVQEVCKHLGGK